MKVSIYKIDDYIFLWAQICVYKNKNLSYHKLLEVQLYLSAQLNIYIFLVEKSQPTNNGND